MTSAPTFEAIDWGLSTLELATIEGIPLGTAKSRVRLGLAKLSGDPELVAA